MYGDKYDSGRGFRVQGGYTSSIQPVHKILTTSSMAHILSGKFPLLLYELWREQTTDKEEVE